MEDFIPFPGNSFNPNERATSASYSTGTVVQNGTNTVVGTGTSFTAAMLNGTIAYSNGQTAYITAVNSPTNLTVNPSQVVNSGNPITFIIHYTSGTATNLMAMINYSPATASMKDPFTMAMQPILNLPFIDDYNQAVCSTGLLPPAPVTLYNNTGIGPGAVFGNPNSSTVTNFVNKGGQTRSFSFGQYFKFGINLDQYGNGLDRNLKILGKAMVSRVLLDTSNPPNAIGLEYYNCDTKDVFNVYAKQVILSGSTFNNPGVLIRSGISHPAISAALGIKNIVPNPNVGYNYLNQPLGPTPALTTFNCTANSVGGPSTVLNVVFNSTNNALISYVPLPLAGSTTISAGSNGVDLSTLNAGVLNVASTVGFSAGGYLIVQTSSGYATISYIGVTATQFQGLVVDSNVPTGSILSTGGNVYSGLPLYYGNASSTSSTIAGTTLTIGGTVTGTYVVGMTITGFGISSGTKIIALGSGTGGAGTYVINNSQTVDDAIPIFGVAGLPVGTSIMSVNSATQVSNVNGTGANIGGAGTYNLSVPVNIPAGTIIQGPQALVTGSNFQNPQAQLTSDVLVGSIRFLTDLNSQGLATPLAAPFTYPNDGLRRICCFPTNSYGAFTKGVSAASITNAVGDGINVTYYCVNGFSAGTRVNITGVYPNSFNVNNAVVTGATSVYFTIASSNLDRYINGGLATNVPTISMGYLVSESSNVFGNMQINSTNPFANVIIDHQIFSDDPTGIHGYAATTIASGSNGQSLPQSVINVNSTSGFVAPGRFTITTSTGNYSVTYTGLTATSFTGCSGGSGIMATGGAINYDGSDMNKCMTFTKLLLAAATAAGVNITTPAIPSISNLGPFTNDALLSNNIYNNASFQVHAASTCRMGKQVAPFTWTWGTQAGENVVEVPLPSVPNSIILPPLPNTIYTGVCDGRGNVFGVNNLKICDLSVQPNLVDGNPMYSILSTATQMLNYIP
jgi:hypothetical protein